MPRRIFHWYLNTFWVTKSRNISICIAVVYKSPHKHTLLQLPFKASKKHEWNFHIPKNVCVYEREELSQGKFFCCWFSLFFFNHPRTSARKKKYITKNNPFFGIYTKKAPSFYALELVCMSGRLYHAISLPRTSSEYILFYIFSLYIFSMRCFRV